MMSSHRYRTISLTAAWSGRMYGCVRMRRLLSWGINAPKTIRAMWLSVSPFKFQNTQSLLLCTSSSQGDSICNGTHSKKALLSDPQLFEEQFEELVTELAERDFTDPALADALNRLREVCVCAVLSHAQLLLTSPELPFYVSASLFLAGFGV